MLLDQISRSDHEQCIYFEGYGSVNLTRWPDVWDRWLCSRASWRWWSRGWGRTGRYGKPGGRRHVRRHDRPHPLAQEVPQPASQAIPPPDRTCPAKRALPAIHLKILVPGQLDNRRGWGQTLQRYREPQEREPPRALEDTSLT